jgi:protein CpxP
MQRILHNAIAAAALTLTAALANAQTPPPPAPMQAPMAESGSPDSSMHAARHYRHEGDWHKHRAERMQKHLDALKAKLALTPEQEGAWTTFTTALKPETSARNGDAHEHHMDRAAWTKMTTPERIDQMRTMRARRFAMADARGEATKTFYAALTPTQQKTFDEQASHMMMKRHGDRHHQEGHHGEAN